LRLFPLLPALVLMLTAVISTVPAVGQTTETTTQSSGAATESSADTTTDNSTTETKENEKDPATVQAEADEAELDAALIASWVLISTIDKDLDDKRVEAAAKRCVQRPKLKSLTIEPGAARKLPNAAQLFGDLVYYRTETGLQRFDLKSGQITLIRQIKKIAMNNNRRMWALRGRVVGFRIRFSNPIARKPGLKFMIEEGGFYLRCGLAKQSDS